MSVAVPMPDVTHGQCQCTAPVSMSMPDVTHGQCRCPVPMPDVTHGQCQYAVPVPDVTHGQCQWQCQRLVSLTDNVSGSASVDVNACCHSWTMSVSVPDVIHGRCQCQRQCLMSLMDNVSVQCQCLMSLMDNVSGSASFHSCTMSMAVPVSMAVPDVTQGQCQCAVPVPDVTRGQCQWQRHCKHTVPVWMPMPHGRVTRSWTMSRSAPVAMSVWMCSAGADVNADVSHGQCQCQHLWQCPSADVSHGQCQWQCHCQCAVQVWMSKPMSFTDNGNASAKANVYLYSVV